MNNEHQQFVNAELSEQCADSAGGSADYDPFEDNSLMPVMQDPEPTYIWDPETDNYYLEQWKSKRVISKV